MTNAKDSGFLSLNETNPLMENETDAFRIF